MILAGIDIGTNTVRWLTAEIGRIGDRLELRPIHEGRRITRLGEGIVHTGRLSPAAMNRTLQALKEFRAEVADFSADRIVGVATSAVREAANREPFLSRVKEEIGLSVEVISGEEEARRTLRGVRYGLGGEDRGHRDLVVIDIGGGSTEWMLVAEGRIREMRTVPTGVVKLTDRYPVAGPLTAADQRRLIAEIEELFRPVVESAAQVLRGSPGGCFVGTAGTVTTLAALELAMTSYDPSRVQNMRLSLDRVKSWHQKLVGMTLIERRRLAGLERGREDLIVAGAALLLTAMRMIGANEVVVSDYGLREGVLIDGFERRETESLERIQRGEVA
ncbi:MAG: Ppx/GppA family phosphatase [Nitrospirae bacterium]|nr:Ppx/GppA family phosphatase [Nitrospirota bacterium]